MITTVWQEVLGVEKIGVNDNLFDRGGNSLLVTKIYQEIKSKLPNNDVKCFSLVDLFSFPTIRSLSQHLSQGNSINRLNQEFTQLDQNISRGKSRLKQRLDKSRSRRR
ncbi:MAG: phosphopantetheine-binding protein [Coleofasciculus sp. G2-EDA-02]